MPKANQLLSVIIPVYNEATGLQFFHESLKAMLESLPVEHEILYVNDGSRDNSAEILAELAKADSAVKPIYLSRNFGKEQATTAGLHHAKGDAAIMLDADGQHPVELIPEFVSKWQDGADVVVGIRTANSKEGFTKRFGSKMFYRLLKALGVSVQPGSTDFRLIDSQVLAEFNRLTEHNRITRALIDWLGYDRDYIHFKAKAREHGEASYSTKKLIQLALNGFVSLSFTPLYLSGYVGIFIMLLSFIVAVFAVVEKYILNDPLGWNITGTAILGILTLFLVGILLIGQGLLAIYVARIYTDTQDRPLYLTKKPRADR